MKVAKVWRRRQGLEQDLPQQEELRLQGSLRSHRRASPQNEPGACMPLAAARICMRIRNAILIDVLG